MSCNHGNFAAMVSVARITDSSVWYADLTLECADCGQKMRFIGFPMGMSPGEPRCSVDETELRIPFAPYSEEERRKRLLERSPLGFEIARAQ